MKPFLITKCPKVQWVKSGRASFCMMPAGKVGGAICFGEGYKPLQEGSLIYLNCQPDLQIMLNRVKDAGGSILSEKKLISPDQNIGLGIYHDSEGIKLRCIL